MPQSSQFKIGTEQFLSQAPPDQYASYAYADNFDLSLLPEDAGIPTTVYQYNAPQIKIESAWDSVVAEQASPPIASIPFLSSGNQLIPPPPAYPHSAYPSPQSSPQQSEFASFAYGKFNGSYDCLNSPCPSLDATSIKQELHILPPSPPESNCETPSPRSACSDTSSSTIKTEPLDADVEFIDLNTLLQQPQQSAQQAQLVDIKPSHQLLRECLEDTTFQKKHNLKPLALESFIGGLAEVRGDFEPVISLALEHAKREADAICAELQISQGKCEHSIPFTLMTNSSCTFRSQRLVVRPGTRMATIHPGAVQVAAGLQPGAAVQRRRRCVGITQRGGIHASVARGKSANRRIRQYVARVTVLSKYYQIEVG